MTGFVQSLVRDRRFGNSTDKRVLERLAWFANDDGTSCRPALSTIADDCQVTGRTVQRAIRNLEDLRLITLVREAHRHAPREYRINLEEIKQHEMTNIGKLRLKRQLEKKHEAPGEETGRAIKEKMASESRGDTDAARGDIRGFPIEDQLNTSQLTVSSNKSSDLSEEPSVMPRNSGGDLRADIFGACLGWLAKRSRKKPAALRSLVGRWCRDFGDATVIHGFENAARASPVDPVSWLEAHFRRGGRRNGRNRRTQAEDRTAILAGLGFVDSG